MAKAIIRNSDYQFEDEAKAAIDCCFQERNEYFRRNPKRNLNCFPMFKDEGEVVAAWGQAQLIKYLNGKLELKGGSKEDRIEARECISMLLNEAVVREV